MRYRIVSEENVSEMFLDSGFDLNLAHVLKTKRILSRFSLKPLCRTLRLSRFPVTHALDSLHT